MLMTVVRMFKKIRDNFYWTLVWWKFYIQYLLLIIYHVVYFAI